MSSNSLYPYPKPCKTPSTSPTHMPGDVFSPARYCPRGHDVSHVTHVPSAIPPQPSRKEPEPQSPQAWHLPAFCPPHPAVCSPSPHDVHVSHLPGLMPPHPGWCLIWCQKLALLQHPSRQHQLASMSTRHSETACSNARTRSMCTQQNTNLQDCCIHTTPSRR